MPFIGNTPSAVPLTSADIADSIITSAKIVDGTIVNADINASAAIATSKLSGGTNTPAFFVYPTSSQTATHNTTNKITFGTESYDTDSAFASSRFTVPAGKAGKYYIHASVFTEAAANGTLEVSELFIYINGVAKFKNSNDFRTNQIRSFTATVSSSFNLSVADYVEIYHYYYSSALANGTYGSGDTGGTYFGGFKLIE